MELGHQSSRDWSNLSQGDLYDPHATQWFLQMKVPVRPTIDRKMPAFWKLDQGAD